jgi:hypothetical protein
VGRISTTTRGGCLFLAAVLLGSDGREGLGDLAAAEARRASAAAAGAIEHLIAVLRVIGVRHDETETETETAETETEATEMAIDPTEVALVKNDTDDDHHKDNSKILTVALRALNRACMGQSTAARVCQARAYHGGYLEAAIAALCAALTTDSFSSVIEANQTVMGMKNDAGSNAEWKAE